MTVVDLILSCPLSEILVSFGANIMEFILQPDFKHVKSRI
jgi:hypothetical protein